MLVCYHLMLCILLLQETHFKASQAVKGTEIFFLSLILTYIILAFEQLFLELIYFPVIRYPFFIFFKI